jgi:hypothetical protein
MSFLSRFVDRIKRFNEPLDKWYQVVFDDHLITINASPPGRHPWKQSVEWGKVVRVLFQGNGLERSDEVIFWSDERPEGYVVPTDCNGGREIVDELIARGYFSSKNFTDTVLSPYGMYCWPEDEANT